jgi:HAD superfamily hydrolase (TIGR01509 family)
MLKNYVFDLGGVLFDWNPDRLLDSVTGDPEKQRIIRRDLLEHLDWHELDRGAMDHEEAIVQAASRSNLSKKYYQKLFKNLAPSLKVKQDTLKFVKELREQDVPLYVLSNMHKEVKDFILHSFSFWDLFNGLVFSCDVGFIKPEAQIYEVLLGECRLKPSETVFFDDSQVNVEAAAAAGIFAVEFKNSIQAREELFNLLS